MSVLRRIQRSMPVRWEKCPKTRKHQLVIDGRSGFGAVFRDGWGQWTATLIGSDDWLGAESFSHAQFLVASGVLERLQLGLVHISPAAEQQLEQLVAVSVLAGT